MSLAPLLAAPLAVQLHAAGALAALGIGVAQLALPKGGARHRALGWAWVLLMAATALSSFFISGLRWWGPFGPIHLLSAFTLVSLVGAVQAARRRNMARHRRIMQLLFWLALVGAGLFTLLPGRIMGQVVFG